MPARRKKSQAAHDKDELVWKEVPDEFLRLQPRVTGTSCKDEEALLQEEHLFFESPFSNVIQEVKFVMWVGLVMALKAAREGRRHIFCLTNAKRQTTYYMLERKGKALTNRDVAKHMVFPLVPPGGRRASPDLDEAEVREWQVHDQGLALWELVCGAAGSEGTMMDLIANGMRFWKRKCVKALRQTFEQEYKDTIVQLTQQSSQPQRDRALEALKKFSLSRFESVAGLTKAKTQLQQRVKEIIEAPPSPGANTQDGLGSALHSTRGQPSTSGGSPSATNEQHAERADKRARTESADAPAQQSAQQSISRSAPKPRQAARRPTQPINVRPKATQPTACVTETDFVVLEDLAAFQSETSVSDAATELYQVLHVAFPTGKIQDALPKAAWKLLAAVFAERVQQLQVLAPFIAR